LRAGSVGGGEDGLLSVHRGERGVLAESDGGDHGPFPRALQHRRSLCLGAEQCEARDAGLAGNECVLVPFEGKDHGFFKGSFFRKSNGDADYEVTMQRSIEFLKAHGILK
jgi:hypothetical protein